MALLRRRPPGSADRAAHAASGVTSDGITSGDGTSGGTTEDVTAATDPRVQRLAALAAADGSGVQDLLREVAEFRLALETDLVIAAAAVEADAPEIADDVVVGALAANRRVTETLLDHLVADARQTRPLRRRPRAAAAAPSGSVPTGDRRGGLVRRPLLLVTGVTAVLGLVGGVAVGMQLTSPGAPTLTASTTSLVSDRADRSLERLAAIAQDADGADNQQWVAATTDLHSDINTLIAAAAGGDETAAAAAQDLLNRETLLLATVPGVLSQQLRDQVNGLTLLLQRAMAPTASPSVSPLQLPVTIPSLSPAPSPSSASPAPPAPTATSSTPVPPSGAPSTTAAATPSSSPSTTASPGSSGTGPGVGVPGVGNGHPAV